MLVLGAVQEVGDLELTVSLPNNMCGVVAISNLSDPVTEQVEAEVADREDEEEEEVRTISFHNVICNLPTGSDGFFTISEAFVLYRTAASVLRAE